MNRRAFIAAAAAAPLVEAQSRPNIVVILMDDMAQRALSCYGNPHVKTPHLDRLAQQGVRFTDAYVTPQCTPTRATILTGQYTARNRMWHVIPRYGCPWARVEEPAYLDNLPRAAFTLAKGLQQAGYATACMGKWHLTTNEDGNYVRLRSEASRYYGFDVTSGEPPDPKAHATGDKEVNRLTDESIRFIERNRRRPFFLYLSHHSIHAPVAAPDPVVGKYRDRGYPETGLNNATYLAALEHMDASVGRLMSALDDAGVARNTAVIFLTDNGGVFEGYEVEPGSSPPRMKLRLSAFESTPFRFGKGSAYEGGTRVPMIVRWPGHADAGAVCRAPIHGVDLMPTVFEMAGVRAPADHVVDGVSFLPLLRKGGSLPARSLYWYMPFYDTNWAHTPAASIRRGDLKLIEFFGDYIEPRVGAPYTVGQRLELYDLGRDPGESHDLARERPDTVRELRAGLHDWIRSCGATVPKLNPAYDPARPLEVRRG